MTNQFSALEFQKAITQAMAENKDQPREFDVTPNPFWNPEFVEANERKIAELQAKVRQTVNAKPKMHKELPVVFAVRNRPPQVQQPSFGTFSAPSQTDVAVPASYPVTANNLQVSQEDKKNESVRRFEAARSVRRSQVNQKAANMKIENPDDIVKRLQSLPPEHLAHLLNLTLGNNQQNQNVQLPVLQVSSSIEIPESKEEYLDIPPAQIESSQ